MKLYLLHRAPDESAGEGEDWNEWFGSLREANARRAELIQQTDWSTHRYGADFKIERVELAKLPKRQLLLAALNGRRCFPHREVIVAEYAPP